MQSLSFAGENGQSVEIYVHGYERAPTGNHFDDNWLRVEVTICAGGFNGKFSAAFLAGELETFHKQMSTLHTSLKGTAAFQTLEQQLDLTLVGDGLGHIRLEGLAQDRLGIGNRLSFRFNFDQTQLQVSVNALGRLLSEFPSRT